MSRRDRSSESWIRRYGRHWLNFWAPNGLNSLWWLLFALPPLHFFQTLIHEGSHGFAAFCCDGDFPKIAPFPHYNTAPAFDGFLNGVAFTGGRGYSPIPQIIDLILVGVFVLIFLFGPVRSWVARFLLRTWFLGVCIDLFFNTCKGLYGKLGTSSDWGRFLTDNSKSEIIALTWSIWLIIILGHLVWVYFSAWHRDELERARFWDYRWIAVVCGVLSILAITFSIAISDQDINKIHIYFIGPLIIQCLSVLWYITYFILSWYYTS